MKKFYIIGIDDNGQREFQAEVREIITTHRVFSGGKRHYELMREKGQRSARPSAGTVCLDRYHRTSGGGF